MISSVLFFMYIVELYSHPALFLFFFSSRRRHTRSVSAFLLNRSSDLLVFSIIDACLSTEGVYCSRCVYYGKHQSFQATAGFRDYRSEERRVGKECRSWWWGDY